MEAPNEYLSSGSALGPAESPSIGNEPARQSGWGGVRRVEWELTQARSLGSHCRVWALALWDSTNQSWCLLMVLQFPGGLGYLEGIGAEITAVSHTQGRCHNLVVVPKMFPLTLWVYRAFYSYIHVVSSHVAM